MSSAAPAPQKPRPLPGTGWSRFWNRVTEGMAMDQLWSQFRADTRAGYRFYSKEINQDRTSGMKPGHKFWFMAEQFFWAVMEKLSPARRVLLLVALVSLLFGQITWHTTQNQTIVVNPQFWGGLLMFLLLILEIGDRVIMKRDLQIAKEIQQWLLPATPPIVPGMEVAFVTRPANTVAGDFYDVFPRTGGNDHWLIACADVAGKSMPAALLMATFQASLKTLSTADISLPDLAASMNKYACTNSQQGRRFTTAFLAEYTPATRTLTYINAGHNNPMLRRATGQLERLDIGGIPLGMMEDVTYPSATLTLNPGDWLVIFTDGVVEAENDHAQEYGEDRLIAVVNANLQLGPAQMLYQIMTDVDRFVAMTPQHDDITCLLIKAV
ncbi:serine phosphatase [Candidatus Koribacter versatilis Ellin345]|uniref:Serine phosphatase n=1 Tax=Koribacter versatilis (strain Ellin345) TaxID=204669 RepID=Q1IT38_KORVE|nr:PP2C family protein-serine/threonine phosphatase [Candidatus Koribacter versatilis]ABF39962.1 serine phosphatase [Candidatus Koribacter versatilis Ellin345]